MSIDVTQESKKTAYYRLTFERLREIGSRDIVYDSHFESVAVGCVGSLGSFGFRRANGSAHRKEGIYQQANCA